MHVCEARRLCALSSLKSKCKVEIIVFSFDVTESMLQKSPFNKNYTMIKEKTAENFRVH